MDYSYKEAAELGTRAAIVDGGRKFFAAGVLMVVDDPPEEGWPHVMAVANALCGVGLRVTISSVHFDEPLTLTINHMGDSLIGDRVGHFIDYVEGMRKRYDEALSWFIMRGLDRIDQSLDRVEVDDA